MKSLTAGRMVHFVLPSTRHAPAIVLTVVDKATRFQPIDSLPDDGMVDLMVFLDPKEDQVGSLFQYTGEAVFSDQCKVGTWHWIEAA